MAACSVFDVGDAATPGAAQYCYLQCQPQCIGSAELGLVITAASRAATAKVDSTTPDLQLRPSCHRDIQVGAKPCIVE
eukprot:symbB.v1.2.007426.t1/scaffold453.1/size202423/17